ncbi:glutathione S-transferase N-terminal domain-containing protein [Rhodobacteraceae bacterium B1Z28]|uniref:Glutathione S-transferase N-terminal domain-containing protein n=1 Tax=Ruegeria haliotis TaxID=2747601 RepID=A0ABX2PTF1_9RHOB|nr:glutathione binding-like protein [Ruegeria haliotis]NVO56975.1 glutathione S-transferase N-terminal domain-containing protein [Ruegeria haliotis]
MIDLYFAHVPNAQKIHIMLEECGLLYRLIQIDIDAGDQFHPDYLKLNPNNKVPTITDHNGLGGVPTTIFESGAILLHLADKAGKFLPLPYAERMEVFQWLFWQVGGFGPMLGQAHHFLKYAPMRPEEPVVLPYAQDRYRNEACRLYNVLDRRLSESEYVGGDEYSIADMAVFPWARLHERQGQDLSDFPNVASWFERVGKRPAVARSVAFSTDTVPEFTEESWGMGFGAMQYRKR